MVLAVFALTKSNNYLKEFSIVLINTNILGYYLSMLKKRKVCVVASFSRFPQIFTLSSFAITEISYGLAQFENDQTNFLFGKKNLYRISKQPLLMSACENKARDLVRNSKKIQELSLLTFGLTRKQNINLQIEDNLHTLILELNTLCDSKLLVSIATNFDNSILCDKKFTITLKIVGMLTFDEGRVLYVDFWYLKIIFPTAIKFSKELQ